MDFKLFTEQISKIKNLPLPGRDAHYKMAPDMRIQELEATKLKIKNPKKAGVMALFYPDKAQLTHILLILRRSYEGVHSNQVGFPGGKIEKGDTTILDTALRETYEEVGVSPAQIEVIRAVTDLYIPPSNFQVHPFIGLIQHPTSFILQEDEVEQIIEVPLKHFMNDEYLSSQFLSTSYANNIEVPTFQYNGFTVWGATAMMLNEIRELLKQVL